MVGAIDKGGVREEKEGEKENILKLSGAPSKMWGVLKNYQRAGVTKFEATNRLAWPRSDQLQFMLAYNGPI